MYPVTCLVITLNFKSALDNQVTFPHSTPTLANDEEEVIKSVTR